MSKKKTSDTNKKGTKPDPGRPDPIRPESEPDENQPRRPLWVRIMALVILAGLIGALVWSRRPTPRPITAISRAADNATPEIAVLLREINNVACDLIAEFPESPGAFDVMARLHQRFSETDDAIKYWQQAIELDPGFVPAYHSIGTHYLDVGNHGEAAQYLEKALEFEPDSTMFRVELAQALVSDGKVDEGLELLHRDLQEHPRAIATLAMLGHAYIQKRDYVRAKEYFERTIEIGPDYTNAYDGLVKACANLGEEELAKQYAEKLKEMKSRDDSMHRENLKSFDDVVNVKSTMAEIYTTAANVYLAQNLPEQAEQYLHKAIELGPTQTAAYEVLTWLYQRQGRQEDAATALRAFAKVAPDNVTAQMTYADLCLEMGWDEEAETAYRRAIELTPKQAGGYLALARFLVIQAETGKLVEARQLAQKAVDIEPTAEHYYWLGAACQINNDKKSARAAINQAATLDPLNQEYQRVLTLLNKPK